MKYIFLFTVLLILCLAAGVFGGDRVGSSFGYMTTADARGQGVGSVSLGAGLADMTSVVGVFHYGLSRFTDGSIKLGLVDDDDPADTRFSIGADFQYQLLAMGDVSPKPFDLALGGLFEFTSFDNVSVGKYKLTGKGGGTTYHPDLTAVLLGGFVSASYPVTLQGGTKLTPYGRFNARIEFLSFDNTAPTDNDSRSNLEFGLNGGVAWNVSRNLTLFGEFQLDGNDGIFFGLDFDIL